MVLMLMVLLAPLMVEAQDLNLTQAYINVRLVSTNYNMDSSVSSCVSKVSDEFELGQFEVLMERSIACDSNFGTCRSVVVEFPESKTIYFTYRGTTQILQLLQQGPSITEDFLGLGQVKRYYVQSSAAFWEQQESIVTNPKYADYKFVYTGHSLGGALAVLSALRAIIQGSLNGSQIQLMTFGEPRIGHRNFTKKIKNFIANDIRITQNTDSVPNFPSCRRRLRINPIRVECDPAFENSFYHHGMEYWFFNDTRPSTQYRKCDGPPESEDPNCISRFGSVSPPMIGIKTWCDHIVYLGVNMALYGMSGCEVSRLLPGVSCPLPI